MEVFTMNQDQRLVVEAEEIIKLLVFRGFQILSFDKRQQVQELAERLTERSNELLKGDISG